MMSSGKHTARDEERALIIHKVWCGGPLFQAPYLLPCQRSVQHQGFKTNSRDWPLQSVCLNPDHFLWHLDAHTQIGGFIFPYGYSVQVSMLMCSKWNIYFSHQVVFFPQPSCFQSAGTSLVTVRLWPRFISVPNLWWNLRMPSLSRYQSLLLYPNPLVTPVGQVTTACRPQGLKGTAWNSLPSSFNTTPF